MSATGHHGLTAARQGDARACESEESVGYFRAGRVQGEEVVHLRSTHTVSGDFIHVISLQIFLVNVAFTISCVSYVANQPGLVIRDS